MTQQPTPSPTAHPPVKPPAIRERGYTVDVDGDVLLEWSEYLVACDGADRLRVGTEEIAPIVPSLFSLRFENRLGFSVIQPLRKGVVWGPARRVEVASPKLGAYEQYRAFTDSLVNSLHRHGTEKVFDFAGSTSMSAGGPIGDRSLLFILHLLLGERSSLLEALELVCERPHLSLVDRRDVRRLATISRGGKDLIDALLRGRGGWDRAEHLAAGVAMGGFLPSHVEAAHGWETADNPENRFVLALLEQVADVINLMRGSPWWPKVPAHRQSALIDLRYSMVRRADHPLFSDVGRMTGLPTQSRVLTRREGYRQLLGCWSMLNEAVAPLLAHVENAIELRNVDLLYEQWCFFELAEQIGAIVAAAPHFAMPVRMGPLPWKARAEYPGGASLIYNATQPGYSLPFRPDLLWCVDGKPVAIFDAKFRAEVPKESQDWTSDPRRADIDKMHAYRDALGVASATVLYPGTEPRWFAARAAAGTEVTLQRVLEGWNGVGALPFRPEVDNGN